MTIILRFFKHATSFLDKPGPADLGAVFVDIKSLDLTETDLRLNNNYWFKRKVVEALRSI